jgi:hypothetical protein
LLVLFNSASVSAQDLGEIARREQARKAAEPAHSVHVYTNDDLSRPRILEPVEIADVEVPAQKSSPTDSHPVVSQKPVSQQRPLEPQPTHKVTLEVSLEVSPMTTRRVFSGDAPVRSIEATPEVSLGEVARQYREKKIARQTQLVNRPTETAATLGRHIYTNDDMVRPQILTPEDRGAYEATLHRLEPTATAAVTDWLSNGEAVAETPLGDVARLAYRQERFEQERSLEARKAPRLHVLGTWASLASFTTRTRRLIKPINIKVSARRRTRRHSSQHRNRIIDTGFGDILVRPGDSLWKLARVYLGDGSRWQVLLKANPRIGNPLHLRPGTEIRI